MMISMHSACEEPLASLKPQVYHRILPHVFAAPWMFCDGHAVEQRSIRRLFGGGIAANAAVAARWRGLKEVADHAEVQGFAEAAGAGDEVHLAGVIDKMRYEAGFINKVAIIVDEFLKIGDALSQILLHNGFQCSMVLRVRECRWSLGPQALRPLGLVGSSASCSAMHPGPKLSFFSTKRKFNKEKYDSRGVPP